MIQKREIEKILASYDPQRITVGVLGGHSALDVCRGAQRHGFQTVVVCARGRAQTYETYYRSRNKAGERIGCVDKVITVDRFADVLQTPVQEELRKLNTVFVHSRYFWVYFDDFTKIENDFMVPIFGTRHLVKLEERNVAQNQYYLLRQAGISMPQIFTKPQDIDKLVLVKVNEAQRGYERAFFYANNYQSYLKKSGEMLAAGIITEQALGEAVIEEFIVGVQLNCNYFYSPLTGELELMGTDTRRQTNLDGLLRLPADQQLEILTYLRPTMIETGHIAVTTKESLLEKILELGEKFVRTLETESHCAPGIIGPFALQGAVASRAGREEIVVFDVSMRIPGSPGTMFTPYSGYLYGDSCSYGERIAMEIKHAVASDKLALICT